MIVKLIKALFALGILNSSYLLYETLWKQNQYACNVDTCGIVQASKYAYFLGIPVAFWGLIWFIFILIIRFFLINKDKKFYYFYMLLLIFWFLFAWYLQIVSIFVLWTICKFCFLNFMIISTIFILESFIFIKNIRWKAR